MFWMCWLKAITASSGPVNVKLLIKSSIFGKIKKTHGARSELNAEWVKRSLKKFLPLMSCNRPQLRQEINDPRLVPD
ncbi:hypothetical protein EVAR_66396_1 [Eumeta japonica]|uniref:Uncharacterized protein n=1 Tax=Eumeta variegata TaxID=151549 RepID=A0A4C1ZX61_EUMVA|nr:hypothetical protein EVAR_66396_1 [Eumeta japonica]